MARIATLLATACVLLSLSVVSVAAAPREAFNGAVHSDFDAVPDDDMTETHVPGDAFARAEWRDIALTRSFSTRKSWQKPQFLICLLYTSPSPRDATLSRMPSSA